MANLKSSIKDIRRTKRRTKMNNRNRSSADKSLRNFRSFIISKDTTKAKEVLDKVYSTVDKMVKRKIITINKASRIKSRVTKKLNLEANKY